MDILFTDINWVATIVGFILSSILGAIWYSKKAYGTGWMNALGISEEDIEKGGMFLPLGSQSLASLGFSIIIAAAFVDRSYVFAFLLVVTVVLFIISNGFWNMKKTYAIKVEAGFVLVMGIVMIISQILL